MAFDAYLAAFDEDAHPETVDSLETEALIARSRYDDLPALALGAQEVTPLELAGRIPGIEP